MRTLVHNLKKAYMQNNFTIKPIYNDVTKHKIFFNVSRKCQITQIYNQARINIDILNIINKQIRSQISLKIGLSIFTLFIMPHLRLFVICIYYQTIIKL